MVAANKSDVTAVQRVMMSSRALADSARDDVVAATRSPQKASMHGTVQLCHVYMHAYTIYNAISHWLASSGSSVEDSPGTPSPTPSAVTRPVNSSMPSAMDCVGVSSSELSAAALPVGVAGDDTRTMSDSWPLRSVATDTSESDVAGDDARSVSLRTEAAGTGGPSAPRGTG